ncbi:hypothetical protein K2173_028589 [Erythroxylum novogranatense]|uniref:Auxin response factor n=1 Tax=Erythroxylum novogranatense TaxID=1862640 RepID=A0AAV8U2B0_9ROSI|nr:hypothetical protein K2173_028589 [Erythroxylum novogranatense]
MPKPPAADVRRIDPRIWRACAGSCFQIPTVDSTVFYFPQGHLEQSFSPTSTPFLSNLLLSKPFIPCRISDVYFLADPVTDEVYTKLLLVPLSSPPVGLLETSPRLSRDGVGDLDDDEIVPFAKILTPSDANNGGGFSVPRFCADSIFPPLNYQADPPVQKLQVTDIHGVTWEFRHIYRGTPRRHLLTTGWSKFVNNKKLIAGDSVVFMRNSRGQMFIGVRRSLKFNNNNGGDFSRWQEQNGGGGTSGQREVKVKEEGFSRNGRGRVSSEAVAEATERAAQGLPFEVVYYPRVGCYSEFVVRAEVVEASLNVCWSPGMRVKMAMETDDSSRMTWFQGTVAAASTPDCGPWRGSPWRMIQVIWDEPEVLQNAKRVSPWQVEVVSPTSQFDVTFHPSKKFRFPEYSGLLTDREREPFFPLSDLTNSTIGNMTPPLLNNHNFPAGMQGARQDPFSILSFSNLLNDTVSQMRSDVPFGNNMVPKLKNVCTELNIGSSQSENLSPDSHSSVHSSGNLIGNQFCNPVKVGNSTIQLFGKIIHMNQPVENGFENVGSMEDHGSKGYNETEDINSDHDLHSTSSYTELLSRIDVGCQRASAVEACSL